MVKEHAYKDFREKTGSRKSPQSFKKALKAFAKLNGYEFNPVELQNDRGRILRSWKNPVSDQHKVVEMIYMRTPGTPLSEEIKSDDKHIEEDPLPF